MLYERECGVVVMLCGCEEGGMEVCAQYWPTSVGRSLKFGELLVSTVKINARKGLIKRMLTIKNPKVKTCKWSQMCKIIIIILSISIDR